MNDAAQSARDEPWTVGRVLGWAAGDFRTRGFDSPRLDAELLLGRALGVERVRLFTDSARRLSQDELGAYRALIQRRRSGEPIAYILGEREFFGLSFRVDRRVLIPRPDTETLVDVALRRTERRNLFGNALDLCCGSGCVALAFARSRPTWRTVGIDIDRPAVELARDNAHRLGAVFGVSFLTGDLCAPLDDQQRFDLVTANPPYVPSAELEGLDPGIRDFEPRIALDGGPDGLGPARRVVEQACARLAPDAVLALEVGAGQADAAAELLERAGLIQIERQRDYGGIERVVSGRRA